MENNLIKTPELSGKIALVTGGTKGIGRAIADRLSVAGATVIVTARNHPDDNELRHHFIATYFAAEGAKVVVNYASSKEGAERVVKAITDNGGIAIAVQGMCRKKVMSANFLKKPKGHSVH